MQKHVADYIMDDFQLILMHIQAHLSDAFTEIRIHP